MTGELTVIKKDSTKEDFNVEKVIDAVSKSAQRIMIVFDEIEKNAIRDSVIEKATKVALEEKTNYLNVSTMHEIVESVLEESYPKVANSYRNYRNYKTTFGKKLDKIFQESQRIMYLGDKENSNTDSALVSTKRSLTFNYLNKEMYKQFFLNTDELQAIKDGYIYIHDMSSRRDTMNCCLCDISTILKDGFEMGNEWYNEPKTLDVAFDVIGDIVLSAASQQYGGFTVPQVDEILKPYAEISYSKYYDEALELLGEAEHVDSNKAKAKKWALEKVKRDFEQGFQGWEYKFNTVGSSRGDYPFITMTIGLGTSRFEKLASITMLKVRGNGQGKPGRKRPVLFPKIVLLYDKELHGVGKKGRGIYEAGIECSSKAMYPDWLSLTGEGYVASMYKKYKAVISPMGCRAFLSPWYEKGGIKPLDASDKPVFVGRFNVGAITLHLPMILAKARQENKDFYEVLDFYLEMIRNLHKRTYEYIGEMRASTNPLMYCEGGFYGGHLKPNDKVKSILKPMTASFGFTALNELQQLYNKKSLVEDGEFAVDVMKYINKKVVDFRDEDGWLYAIYGTPAESLCGLQVEQFRAKYGIIENVSDREYTSNSFHCHVTEDILPTQKQDLENRFWDLSNGGKIQYVKYPLRYNKEAIKTLVDRAMEMGLYEGINLSMSYCEDCGYEELNMGDECPHCGSKDIVTIDRMNGYLSYSRVKGDTRLNSAKMAEIKERKSM